MSWGRPIVHDGRAARDDRGAPLSAAAQRVHTALIAYGADTPDKAMTDAAIAAAARVPTRNVIELVEELAAIDVAVLATCRDGGGRFLCRDPRMVRTYADKLHRRARNIHGRAAVYSALAERMDAKRLPADSQEQRRLFA